LVFAFGRRGTIPAAFAKLHAKYLTPVTAIVVVAAVALLGLLLGDALLVPITEVGSMASAFGWFAACLSFYLVEKRRGLKLIAAAGAAVSLLFFLMKVLPLFPGHFSTAEWVALAIWLLLGLAMRRSA
jgi:amino acid transporter